MRLACATRGSRAQRLLHQSAGFMEKVSGSQHVCRAGITITGFMCGTGAMEEMGVGELVQYLPY